MMQNDSDKEKGKFISKHVWMSINIDITLKFYAIITTFGGGLIMIPIINESSKKYIACGSLNYRPKAQASNV